MSSATEQQYLNRYKNAAKLNKELFYMPQMSSDDGQPNWLGFWVPVLALTFTLGVVSSSRILGALTSSRAF